MITTKDFPALTADLQSIFNEAASLKVDQNVGFSIFNVFDTNRQDYKHLLLHGLSGIKRVTQGEDLPKVNLKQGDSITFTQEYFGAQVDVTKQMRMFDLYNQIETLVRSVVDSAFNNIDQSFADVLLKGWTTAYTDVYGDSVTAVGPDGLALFSAAHTVPTASATFSNIITLNGTVNAALSRDAIVAARSAAMVRKDANGLVRPVMLDTLVVPPALADLANRIVNSEYIQGSANNDINPLKGSVQVKVWSRLQSASDGTDGSAYWFMYDSSNISESLMAPFAEKPSLDAPEQVYENKNWEYSCDFFYAIGRGFPAFIYGSKGTNS